MASNEREVWPERVVVTSQLASGHRRSRIALFVHRMSESWARNVRTPLVRRTSSQCRLVHPSFIAGASGIDSSSPQGAIVKVQGRIFGDAEKP